MRTSLKTLIVVLLTVMSFAAAQAVHAEILCGYVNGVDPDSNPTKIWIQPEDSDTIVEIIGFPFHNLEAQLEEELNEKIITIDLDDCVKIEYELKENGVKKWLSLLVYCEGCGRGTGGSTDGNCSFVDVECEEDCDYCLKCDSPPAELCFESDKDNALERKPQGQPWDDENHPPGWDEEPPGWDKEPPGWDGTVPPGLEGTMPPGHDGS